MTESCRLSLAVACVVPLACRPAERRADTLVAGPPAAAAAPRAAPRFDDYPAPAAFRGRPAPVDYASDPDARRFRTWLEGARGRGANFAGGYALVTWGCGSECQSGALLDLASGRAYHLPESVGLGTAFRPGSRLLIIDPPEAIDAVYPPGQERPARVRPRYYAWDVAARRWTVVDAGLRLPAVLPNESLQPTLHASVERTG